MEPFGTAGEAKEDANRAAAEFADVTDEQMIYGEAIDAFVEPVALRLVVVKDEDKQCVKCRYGIAPGVAAEETSEAAWPWCGSCASRNPGSILISEEIAAP